MEVTAYLELIAQILCTGIGVICGLVGGYMVVRGL